MKKLLTLCLSLILALGIFLPTIVPNTSDDDLVVVITDEEGIPEAYYKQDESGNLVEIENPNNNSAAEEAARKAEAERIAAEKAAAERAAAEKAAAEKAAAEKAEAERIAAEKAAAEKAAAEKAAAEKAAAEKAAAEKAEAERIAAEKAAAEKAEAEARESLNTGKTGNSKTPDVTLADAQKNSGKCKKLSDPNCGDIYDGKHGLYNFSGGGVDETYDSSEVERLIYEKLNAMRKEMGLAEIVRKEDTSRAWAEVMATTGLFEHATINKPKSGKYSADYAAEDMLCSGENILINATPARYATPEQIAENITNQWNNSEGHYANRTQNPKLYLMNDGEGDYLYYDIAVVKSLSGHYWAVERFGTDRQ